MCIEKNDFRRLKAEADIASVVDYCGIVKGKKIGAAQFVVCPNPAHDDEHPTNAYYRDGWNGIYCTTCARKFWAIDIIMWTLGLDYGNAADVLWELEGRPNWYYSEKQNTNTKKQFSISYSEMELLGIHFSSTSHIPVRFTKAREKIPEELEKGCKYTYTGNGYLLSKSEHTEWEDFISRKNMKSLVLSRCAQMEKEMDEMEHRLGYFGIFNEKREKIRELKTRAEDRSLV